MCIKDMRPGAIMPDQQQAVDRDRASIGTAGAPDMTAGPDRKRRNAQAVVDADQVSATTKAQAEGEPIADASLTEQSPEDLVLGAGRAALRLGAAIPVSTLLRLAEAVARGDAADAVLRDFAAQEAEPIGEYRNRGRVYTEQDDATFAPREYPPLSAEQAVALARRLRVQLGVEKNSKDPRGALRRALARINASGSPTAAESDAGASRLVSDSGDQEKPS